MNYNINKIVEEQRKKGLLIRLDLNRLKEIIREFDKNKDDLNLNTYQIVFLNGLVLEVLK